MTRATYIVEAVRTPVGRYGGVLDAHRQIAVGDAEICVAGGVESMSRAPWVVLEPERGHATMWSTTLGWSMTNPRLPEQWTVTLG